MTKFSSTVSIPGVVFIFGRFSAIFGNIGLGSAIDLRLELEVKQSEFEFSVVDGYKLDPHQHRIFQQAMARFWPNSDKYPLEFNTKSQLPNLNGLCTSSSLSLALTGVLLDLKAKKSEPENKGTKTKIFSKIKLAQSAFQFENTTNSLATPLSTTIAIAGGVIYSDTIKDGSLWPLSNLESLKTSKIQKIPKKKVSIESTHDKNDKKYLTLYAHSLPTPLQFNDHEELSFVIGSIKNLGLLKFSKNKPKRLFDKPMLAKQRRELLFKRSIKSDPASSTINQECISNKLERFKTKSGFAKDNILEMGKLVKSSLQMFKSGDFEQLGALMKKNQNLLTILGVYPRQLRSLAEAAEVDSYGVSVIGEDGNMILSLPKDPERVVERIENSGGDAVIVNISKSGFNFK